MNTPTAYHQLGKFVVSFQHLDESVKNLLELLSDDDGEVVRILVNELEYSKRLKTADVVFARFVDLRKITDSSIKAEFHKLIVELDKIGTRRNELIHSSYNCWMDIQGSEGLLRTNSKLRGSKGVREEKEEELQSEAFNADLSRLDVAAQELEAFRLKVIDWLNPP
jgi:hypothetical protein